MIHPDTLCPCCNGSRGRWQHFDDHIALYEDPDAVEEHIEGGDCKCRPRFDACLACRGTGELTGIARATLLARGDIAPVGRRGYA